MGEIFVPRFFCINDFRDWDDRKELKLAPYWQRRSVWSKNARSYLIDTILRNLPLPKIYIRHRIDPKTRKSIREVVDGQQRLKAILNFLRDGFKVSKIHNPEYGDLYFSELPKHIQNKFLKYEISVDLIYDSKDEVVLDIFARLNTYTVTLNPQELLNARYFGDFKQTVYRLGWEFYRFWISNRILTQRRILRMAEAELTSELVIAMIDGIQPKTKKVLEKYYHKYDNKFPIRDSIIARFKHVMDTIGGIFEDTLPASNFRRKPHFYTLFCVIYDLIYRLKNSPIKTEKGIAIKPSIYPKIRSVIADLDAIFDNKENYPKYKTFVEAFERHTTNLPERILRHKVMAKIILKALRG